MNRSPGLFEAGELAGAGGEGELRKGLSSSMGRWARLLTRTHHHRVGGGGAGKERKARIVEKNQRLEEQRIRQSKEKKETGAQKKTETQPAEKGAAAKEDVAGHIHPSRRGRVR